ncbi:hypothetical protein NA57DRAFT_74047 [Rhizodiscina lignyota]|uniref:SnoaL-like domain-containing protein n=1 Tax=Rhizodiscina lignyota TaxID=1504668 RepID=A0A9P4M7H5_9PEZI|nr:hypothetical protein NA57DRAFT_74047 [Rhizodiscina lignyota]
MRPQSLLNVLVSPAVAASCSSTPLLCTAPFSPSYEKQLAKNSATFHMNFNKRDTGRKANGALASVSIDWTANDVDSLGRKPFVEGLDSFDSWAPDIKISDHIHVNDGNKAAILYYFQGHQTGEFNGVPPSGNAIEILNGEFMLFDEDVLLNRLITVNENDILQLQVTGKQKVGKFQDIKLISTPPTEKEYQEKIKNVASQFNKNFNLRKTKSNAALTTTDVQVLTDQGTKHGRDALLALFDRYETSFPDLLAHDEYILAEGHLTAIEFIWLGTFSSPFKASNGSTVQPDGKSYRTRGMRWMRHNDEGLVDAVWQVATNDDLITNVQN